MEEKWSESFKSQRTKPVDRGVYPQFEPGLADVVATPEEPWRLCETMHICRWYVLWMCLFVWGCGEGSSRHAAGEAGIGSLVAEPPEVHFVRDPSPEHPRANQTVVQLRNEGSEPLNIMKVQTTCACTVAQPLTTTELAPGDEVELNLNLNPPNFGRRETRVLVQTDIKDAQPLVIPIVLEGNTLESPQLKEYPRQVQLTGFRPGTVAQTRIGIWTIEFDDAPPWLTGLRSTSGAITAKPAGEPVEERAGEGVLRRFYQFSVDADVPDFSRQTNTDSLQFETRTGNVDRHILVSVQCVPAIRVVPEQLYFSVTPDSVFPIERKIMLIGDSPSLSWTVEGSDATPAWLQVTGPGTPPWSGSARIVLGVALSDEVRNAFDAVGTPIDATLSLTITHPECDGIAVPVRVVRTESVTR